MTYYPVVIPTLNRFEHFKECVESLAACTHADKTELVIGLDYPPSEKYFDGWKRIKEYISSINGFYKITIFEHKYNLGPFENTNFLRNYVFEHYDAYIFTEDDNIFSPCFLDYMDKCLDQYFYDEKVMYICGCLEPEQKRLLEYELNNSNSIIKVIGNLSAYGLGIWKNKELELRRKFPKDFRKYIFNSKIRIIKLLRCPAKLNHIYFWIQRKPELNRICDFTRNAWSVLNEHVNILPTISLVRNNGFDGSGENCGFSLNEIDSWNNMIISQDKIYNIVDELDKKDIKRMSKILYDNASKNERKEIRPIVIFHLILGWHLTQFLFNSIQKFRNFIHKTYIWKYFKNIKNKLNS